MIFDEADIELQAENILITDGGKLQIGQEGAPFQHKAIITLHGHQRSPEIPVYGAKTLGVREGILDLHGRDIFKYHHYIRKVHVCVLFFFSILSYLNFYFILNFVLF